MAQEDPTRSRPARGGAATVAHDRTAAAAAPSRSTHLTG